MFHFYTLENNRISMILPEEIEMKDCPEIGYKNLVLMKLLSYARELL